MDQKIINGGTVLVKRVLSRIIKTKQTMCKNLSLLFWLCSAQHFVLTCLNMLTKSMWCHSSAAARSSITENAGEKIRDFYEQCGIFVDYLLYFAVIRANGVLLKPNQSKGVRFVKALADENFLYYSMRGKFAHVIHWKLKKMGQKPKLAEKIRSKKSGRKTVRKETGRSLFVPRYCSMKSKD